MIKFVLQSVECDGDIACQSDGFVGDGIGNVQFRCQVQRDVNGVWFVGCQLHQGLLDEAIVLTDAQFQDDDVLAAVTPEELICLTAFVRGCAVLQHILKSAFHFEDLFRFESGQFQMRVGIRGETK